MINYRNYREGYFLSNLLTGSLNWKTVHSQVLFKDFIKFWFGLLMFFSEAVVWRCSVKKLLFIISQNSLENIRTKLEKLLQACIKNRLQHRCFPINKIFKNTYYEENLRTLASDFFVDFFINFQGAPFLQGMLLEFHK